MPPQLQEACVHVVTVEHADVAVQLRIEPVRLDLLSDDVSFRSEPLGRHAQMLGFVEAKEPVQGDPAHGLGIRVVPRLRPDLPDAGVRLPPATTHGLAEACEHLRCCSVDPLSA